MGISDKEDSRSAIFNRLDDIQFGAAPASGSIRELGTLGRNDSAEAKAISASTADKEYRKLTSAGNVTTYSLLQLLHVCPRKYELEKLKANAPAANVDDGIVNLDFAFGHAVGAGIQTYGATKSLTAALFACWLSWRAPYDAEKIDKRGNATGKSLTWACYAVEKFADWYEEHLADWEVVMIPVTCPTCGGDGVCDDEKACTVCLGAGTFQRKAVELEFAVDFGNGFFHFGHIDTVLRNKETGQLAVWEGKTTGFENVDEALYANSSQALGYSVVVDAIAREIGANGADYEVLYIVYSSKAREFFLLPFGKSRTQRAEWLQDILLDQANIASYQKLGFYPKRGESCFEGRWNSRCPWFGTCSLQNSSIFPGVELRKLKSISEIASVDFKFTLAELIAAQKEHVKAVTMIEEEK